MAVVQNDYGMPALQSREFGANGLVVGLEVVPASAGDFRGIGLGAGQIEPLAVESRGRTQLRRSLAGI